MRNEVPLSEVLMQSQNNAARCRFLYVVGQLGLGGLERQLYYLLANLDHAQYQPAVVVWNVSHSEKNYRDIQALKVPVYGFPPHWSVLSKMRAFRSLARQVAPEVIHSYGFPTNFIAYYGARGTAALSIGSLRADFSLSKSEDGMIRGALNARWPSFHISNSTTSAEAARRHTGPFTPKQVVVVRNGLDLTQFSSSNKTLEAKDYVAAVGSLLPVKRWDRLLGAVKQIKEGLGNVRFRIAGDGPIRSSLENMARDLDLTGSVEFLGAIHDIPSFLRGAKFLVHTSESEGCPNAVMEAMACGLPVVATESGDIPYLVDESRTGFIVRQDDEKGLVARITHLLQDNELSRMMGIASRKKAEREFSLQRLVSETLNAYRSAGWKG